MKILGYNSRGIQRAAAIRALLNLLKRNCPDVLFLSETHLDEWAAEGLRRKLKMDFKEVVQSDGRSGGLLLLWKKVVVVSLRYKTKNYIDVFVGNSQQDVWRFTGLYGEPRWQDKHLTWQCLRDLDAAINLPWLVMGDINEILYPFEKEGGNPRPQHFMQAFRQALDDCNLSDFGYIGDKFTWHRGSIRERLDRALTNEAWNQKFANATLQNLEYSNSDHRPILMSIDCDDAHLVHGPNVLRFEAKWLKEAHFRQVVEEAWEQAGTRSVSNSLAERLALVHDHLHKWDRSILQKRKKKIRNKQVLMEKVACDVLSDENIEMQRELAKESEELLEQEEIYWAQRSRINWLQNGDKNTSYFHNFAKERRKRNLIKKLRDDNGGWLEDTASLNPMISDYFAGLFSTEVDEPDPELLDKVVPKVSEQMNEQLLKPYSAEEVKKALFSIGDMKAPGSDRKSVV